MPGYGSLSTLPAASPLATVDVTFGGKSTPVEMYRVATGSEAVRIVLFEHSNFSPQGPGRIYCHDGSARPFATDAGKFAFFSAACAHYVQSLDTAPEVVHLHDWHTTFYCLLRDFEPQFAALRDIRTVYTIHNLAMQGTRPLRGDDSSLARWFPTLDCPYEAVADPRYPDCINPMACGIRLADRVNTVSPTYATEILQHNDEAHGFHGGEGLENDLQRVWSDGRLFGILNGCDYPKKNRRRTGWRRLLEAIAAELSDWQTSGPDRSACHEAAAARLAAMPKRRPRHLLSSIGRLTPQKVSLFLEAPPGSDRPALQCILDELGPDGVFIMLGNGDPQLERQFMELCRSNRNFLYLAGYAETFSDLLYRAGDLFLMPSSFEPCGISQMLAMRAGQPCVVHAVGGLKDTVRDTVNGFTFAGDTPSRQAQQFVATVVRALAIRRQDRERWRKIRDNASAARFTWDDAATQYIGDLYE
jgi:starch synthase